MSFREKMCPLEGASDEYKPVRVNTIIATFEQLAVKSNQLVRSETSIVRRSRNPQSYFRNLRRDIQSEHFVNRGRSTNVYSEYKYGEENLSLGGNSATEDVGNGSGSGTTSEERRKRLTSLDEVETVNSELVKTKAMAKAILKKYDDEVLLDNELTAPEETEHSIYIPESDYSAILDNESEGQRTRLNSLSQEFCETNDEYIYLRVAKAVNKISEEAENEDLKPTYENVATLKKIVKDGNIADHENVYARTGSVYRKELVNDSNARTHSREKKKYLIDELIQTEERYIKDLQFVIKNYMEYISSNYTGDPVRKYKFIFLNIEMITVESKLLLNEIKANTDNYETIGKIFCKYKTLLDRYIVYCKNKRTSEQLIHGQYAEIIEKRRKEIRDALGLHSYLLKPIQRLLRYEMFLKKLDKYLELEGTDATFIKQAITLVKKTARTGNDLIVINCIEQMPHSLEDTGDFVMADSFKMLVPYKMDIQLFLFTKIVVFAAKKDAETFVYKTFIPLEHLTKSSDQQKTTLSFEDYYMKKKHKDPSFILDAMNMEKKVKWMESIDNILWKQYRKMRDEAKVLSLMDQT